MRIRISLDAPGAYSIVQWVEMRGRYHAFRLALLQRPHPNCPSVQAWYVVTQERRLWLGFWPRWEQAPIGPGYGSAQGGNEAFWTEAFCLANRVNRP